MSSEADSCASQLEQLHKLLVEVQGIVNYGSFNTTGRSIVWALRLWANTHLYSKPAQGEGGGVTHGCAPCGPTVSLCCDRYVFDTQVLMLRC